MITTTLVIATLSVWLLAGVLAVVRLWRLDMRITERVERAEAITIYADDEPELQAAVQARVLFRRREVGRA